MSAAVIVGYQGVPGAYSQAAVFQLFGEFVVVLNLQDDTSLRGFESFEGVFTAVASGECTYGLVPIENTLGGSIHANYDLLVRYPLHVVGEVSFRVQHCLLARKGVKKEKLTRIISHPQALAQCREYVKRLGATEESVYDTAGSALLLSQDACVYDTSTTGCIASRAAALEYKLDVLDCSIQDASFNVTRFLLLGRETLRMHELQPPIMKTSLMLVVGHEPGALFKVLAAFALRDLQLCKIESRPVPARHLKTLNLDEEESVVQDGGANNNSGVDDGSIAFTSRVVLFYMDVLTEAKDPKFRNALAHLRETSPFVRVLGSYASGISGERFTRDALEMHHPSLKMRSRSVHVGCRSSEDVVRPTAAENSQSMQLDVLGIIGLGTFGAFLAGTFALRRRVVTTSRSDRSAEAVQLGCEFVPNLDFVEMFRRGVNVFVICVSIRTFPEVVSSLHKSFVDVAESVEFSNTSSTPTSVVVTDMLSVKAYPKELLLKYFSKDIGGITVDLICSHPMFGPSSGRYGWQNLPFVYEVLSCRNLSRCNSFIRLFQEQGCRMINTSCEEHDALTASSQFIVHLTGRILSKLDLQISPIATKSFKLLLEIVRNVENDNFDLFYGLFKFNQKSAEEMAAFSAAFKDIQKDLRREELLDDRRVTHLEVESFPEDRLSFRVAEIKPSVTVEMHALTAQLKARGTEVLSFCVGEPDFDPPAEVLQATIAAVSKSRSNVLNTRYTSVTGTFELRQAIARYLKEHKGVVYDTDEIVVSNGAKQSIYQVIMACCEEGDEVIVPTPAWVSYVEIVKLARATPVLVATTQMDNFCLTAKALEKVITPKTKLLVLCNPNNPTGAVIDEVELAKLADVLLNNQVNKSVLVLADEIYERLTYDDARHICFASLQGMKERTIVVNGFSKSHAMTGYRVGYMAAHKAISRHVGKLQGQITSCASSISQVAAVAALEDVPLNWMEERRLEMQEKRDILLQGLRNIPGIDVSYTPKGAFYVLADITNILQKRLPPTSDVAEESKIIGSSENFCKVLLEQQYTAIVPGEDFCAQNCIRISYATSIANIEELIKNRLGPFVDYLMTN